MAETRPQEIKRRVKAQKARTADAARDRRELIAQAILTGKGSPADRIASAVKAAYEVDRLGLRLAITQAASDAQEGPR